MTSLAWDTFHLLNHAAVEGKAIHGDHEATSACGSLLLLFVPAGRVYQLSLLGRGLISGSAETLRGSLTNYFAKLGLVTLSVQGRGGEKGG